MNIEMVRGRLDDSRREAILAFWAEHGALTGDAARQRVAEVVCVLVDGAGAVQGVNSVYEAPVALVGNRRFWVYRRFLAPGAPDDAEMAMLTACFEALAAGFDPDAGGPIGLCAFLTDRAFIDRHGAVEWPNGMIYAGYGPEGAQLRIGYFPGARIA